MKLYLHGGMQYFRDRQCQLQLKRHACGEVCQVLFGKWSLLSLCSKKSIDVSYYTERKKQFQCVLRIVCILRSCD